MPKTLLTSTAYLPPLAWYLQAQSCSDWRMEYHENYQKGGYRNRCRIATANGPRWLSIPLEKGKHQGLPIGEVRISYQSDWPRQHIQSIRSAYGRAPYYEFYAPPLFKVLSTPTLLLRQYNQDIMTLLNTWLSPEISPTPTAFFKTPNQDDTVIDLRASRSQLPLSPPDYPQLFMDRYGFNGELTILDLIFCQGPAAVSYLRTPTQ